jgi:hypothetical protein
MASVDSLFASATSSGDAVGVDPRRLSKHAAVASTAARRLPDPRWCGSLKALFVALATQDD